MTEVTILMCDGPTCTSQKDKQPLTERDRWLLVHDGTPDDRLVFRHFCSWACVGQFADAKVANP